MTASEKILVVRKTILRSKKLAFKKVSPDPYSVFFPESHKDVVESHLLNIFERCSKSVDEEWTELINKLK